MFLKTKLIPVLEQPLNSPNIGEFVNLQKYYDIPNTVYYDPFDRNMSSNEVMDLLLDSKKFQDDTGISALKSSIFTDPQPFFKSIKMHGPEGHSEIYNISSVESLKERLQSDLIVFENVLDTQGDLVNSYALNPSVDTLRPLVKNSPFVQQVQECYQSSVVEHMLNSLPEYNLMDVFTFMFQISQENVSHFSCYVDIAIKTLESSTYHMLLPLVGIGTGFGEHSITLLGFYSNPGVLRLPYSVFLSSHLGMIAVQKYSLINMFNHTYELVILSDFSKIFLESLKKSNDNLSNSLSLYRDLGLLKSQPSYVKYLKWLRDPSSFNLSVEIGVNNKTAIGKSSWFNWRLATLGSIGTLFVGLSYYFVFFL